jgi:hypothetical protein
MTRIRVAKNGEFEIDGAAKTIADLTQQFVEKLVDDSLSGSVEYEIEGEFPIARFFVTLRDGTNEDSKLRKLKESMKESDSDCVVPEIEIGAEQIE